MLSLCALSLLCSLSALLSLLSALSLSKSQIDTKTPFISTILLSKSIEISACKARAPYCQASRNSYNNSPIHAAFKQTHADRVHKNGNKFLMLIHVLILYLIYQRVV